MPDLIGYRRVSTPRQGVSGLGLEAQEDAIAKYASGIGAKVLASYTEIETGKRADRPQLAKAIKHARRAKAILCVAKLDRLARNVAFTSALLRSGVEFCAVDNPHATRLTIHILAAVAEDEAERISTRVREALGMAKRRGKLLGSARPGHWSGRESQRLAGARAGSLVASQVNRLAAREAYADLLPDILALRESGQTLRDIADSLNLAGHPTRSGKPWGASLVMRILRRQ